MSYPAPAPTFGYGLLHMPEPGPLGRLVRRRRLDLQLTQPELSDLTEQHGCRVPQNMLSRLESGRTQRMNNVAQLDALAKALGVSNDLDFILGAYAPKLVDEGHRRYDPDVEILPPGPLGDIVSLIRERPEGEQRRALQVLRVMFLDRETK